MANFVTHILYFKLGHVLHPQIKKNPYNRYYKLYVPYVLVEVILHASYMLFFHQFKPWLVLLFNK